MKREVMENVVNVNRFVVVNSERMGNERQGLIDRRCVNRCSGVEQMMMRKIKLILGLLILSSTAMMAQLKQFTLEELNFGGTRYNEMSPEKRYYIWCGDKLVRKYVDKVVSVAENGKEKDLFSLDDLQEALGNENGLIGVSLLNVEFPCEDKALALVLTPEERLLYDDVSCSSVRL